MLFRSLLWMHVTIVRMLHQASPELRNKFEHDHPSDLGIDDDPDTIQKALVGEPVGAGATSKGTES